MKLKNLFTLLLLFVGMFSMTAQDNCDCEEPDWETEGICATVEEDGETYTAWAPSECLVQCWYGDEYTIVDCNNGGWGDDCDCPEEDWSTDGICVELEYEGETFIEWAPSECLVQCWYDGEYEIVECDDIEWSDDCECEEQDWEGGGICVEVVEGGVDSLIYIAWVPSECYAACWYGEYTLTDCDYEYEDECDCPEEDWTAEGFCIEVVYSEFDSLIFVEWVPSECYADCWYEGYTVIDCEEGGFYGTGGECDWENDCDCEIDSEEGICIAYVWSDSLFGVTDTLIEWVPNTCFADCWGFEDYAIIDCEDVWDWEEEDEGTFEILFGGDEDCIIALFESLEETIPTFQEFLIGLGECGALELDECVLAAPVFETDDEFIEYLSDNCPEWFGFVMDESEGPSVFTSFVQSSEEGNSSTAVKDIKGLEVSLLGNPVVDQVQVSINTAEAMDVRMVLTSQTGQVLNTENIKLAKGEQVYQLNTNQYAGGIYNMTMTSTTGTQTIKFVVVK